MAAPRWAAGLAALLLIVLSACTDPTGIGNELPSNDSSGLSANYTDTITVRTSTVLTDSVVSSTSDYLLVGRYADARLGTLTARGYVQPGLSAAFAPAGTAVFDSLVLELQPDAYRYGDTTRSQHLQVHRLQTDLRGATAYYTSDSRPFDAQPLGSLTFRAGRSLRNLRIPLLASAGRQLFAAAQSGGLSTQDEFASLLPGLVLAPGATDDAAVVRFSVTAAGSVLHLYYHEAAAPDQVLTHDFVFADSPGHFYELAADRRSTRLAALTGTRQAIGSSLTAEEAYIQAGLGLQTKLEFPYLLDFRQLGGTFVINGAELDAEVLTDSETPFLPPPAALAPRLTDRGNHLGSYFLDADGAPVTAALQRGTSPRTGLDRGLYVLSLSAYCRQVLARTIPNNGILLGATDADAVTRVVLGGGRHGSSPMRLKLYYTRIGG